MLAVQVRQTAERELEALSNHVEYMNELEQNRDNLLDYLEGVASDALDSLTSEKRHQVYKMLWLGVKATSEMGLWRLAERSGTTQIFVRVKRYQG